MKAKSSLFPLYLVSFIDAFGFSVVLPFLVFLVNDFGGNAIIYGLLGATYSAFQLTGAPILGRMSDTYGRRLVLLLSQAGTALSWVVFLIALFIPITTLMNFENSILGSFALTVPLIIVFVSRAFDGLTGGNISVANALLADLSNTKNLKTNYGRMGVAGNMGFIAGPVIAGLFGATIFGYMLPVTFALIVSVMAIFIILFYLRDVRKKETEETKSKDTWKVIFKIRFVPYLLILNFIIFLGFNIFYTAFPVHALQGLGWGVIEMGIYFAVISGLMALVQGFLLGWIGDKFSDAILVIVGMVILASSFLFMMSSSYVLLYVAALFFAVGNGIMWPSFLSIVSKAAGDKHQGYVQGVASSSGSLASIIGLTLGGFLYDQYGAFTFAITAITLFFVFILTMRLKMIERECEF